MEKSEGQKRAVIVNVASRDNHNGWFALGQHWAEGSHDAELTDAEIENLVQRSGIQVIDKASGRAIGKAATPRAVTYNERVTAEERKLLEEHRKSQAKSESKPAEPIKLGENPGAKESQGADSPPPGSDLSQPPASNIGKKR